MKTAKALKVMLIAVSLAATAGCGNGDGKAPEDRAARRAPVVVDLPPATADAAIVVTGATAGGAEAPLRLDLASLRALPQEKATIYEPFEKKRVTFTVVRMEDLVASLKPVDGAKTVHLVALDDFEVDITMAEIKAGGVLLAIADGEGKDIPVDAGGPARVIFRDGVKSGSNPDQWIWSVSEVELR